METVYKIAELGKGTKRHNNHRNVLFFVPFCGYSPSLEPDIDPAFEQFGILAELRVLGTQTLIQQVAGVDNGLDLPGEHAKRR